MSDISSSGRRRRADAERSSSTVLAAAVELLGRRPQAGMEEIAAAAGVARQTVYAHYSSRDRLLAAVIDHLTVEVVAVFDGLDVDSGSALDALSRWVEAAWQVLVRYPILLTDAVALPPGDEYRRHLPISERLVQVLDRGRREGDVDDEPPVSWLVSAIVGLGHAAAQEVAAGRTSMTAAGDIYRRSVVRLCAATRSDGEPVRGDAPRDGGQ